MKRDEDLLSTDTVHGELVGSAKAARMLGMHERTITRWCRQGRLEGAEYLSGQRSSKWLIPVASLRKYRLLKEP